MKRLVALFLVLISSYPVYGQFYNTNDWIDYSKTYYIFSSYENSSGRYEAKLHRITYDELNSAGMTGIVGSDLQMWSQGEELPIYVSTNGAFSSGDFIEFYGKINDGTFDTQLFTTPNHQNHTFKSLFTDKNRFYLTLNPGGNNLRITDESNTLSGAPAKEQFFMHQSVKVIAEKFLNGLARTTGSSTSNYYPDFEGGEGWGGQEVKAGSPRTQKVPTNGLYTGTGISSTIETGIVGQSNDSGIHKDQIPVISVNSNIYMDTDTFPDYSIRHYTFSVNESDLSTDTNFSGDDVTVLSYDGLEGQVTFGTNTFTFETRYSPTYVRITYPRNFNFDGAQDFAFSLDTSSDKLIEVENFGGSNTAYLHDLTNNRRLTISKSGTSYPVRFNYGGSTDTELFMADASEIKELQVEDVRQFVDYSVIATQGNYIMITHSSLREGPDCVGDHASYRSSTIGGAYDVIVVDIDELYHQFAHGIETHPLSIKHFANYAINNWAIEPEFLYLVGKSIMYRDTRTASNFDRNLVPTYGYRPSDLYLSSKNSTDYRPQLATGRLPAETPEDVCVYFEKLQKYESYYNTCNREDREWMDNVLVGVQGKGDSEHATFLSQAQEHMDILTESQMGAEIIAVLEDDEKNGRPPQPDYYTHINNGVGIVDYVGHALDNYWDFNGPNWPESMMASSLNNECKYPVFVSNSCFVGQIHSPGSNSMAEDYILEPEAGAIGFLAALALSDPFYLSTYSNELFNNIGNDLFGQTFGEAIKQTVHDIYTTDIGQAEGIKVISSEFTFTGDPALRPYQFTKPEFIVEAQDVTITANGNVVQSGDSLEEINEIEVTIDIHNMGLHEVFGSLEVQISRYDALGNLLHQETQTITVPQFSTTIGPITFPISNLGTNGENTVVISVDSNGAYDEDCEDNNSVTYNFTFTSDCESAEVNILNLNDTYCQDASVQLPLEINFTSGEVIFNIQTEGTVFQSNVLSLAAPGVYNIQAVYTDTNGCIHTSAVRSVEVLRSPVVSVSVIGAENTEAQCVGGQLQIAAGGDTGGEFTYAWDFNNGSTSDESGPHTISYDSPGNKTITLTTGFGDCTYQQTVNVQIYEQIAPPALFCSSASESSVTFNWEANSLVQSYVVNIDGTDITLEGGETSYTVEGLSSGAEVTAEVYATGLLSCMQSNTATIVCTVGECMSEVPIEIAGLPTGTVCSSDASFTLTGTPGGGEFIGSAMEGSVFNPALAAVGENTITYIFIDQEGCSHSSNISIEVGASPVASFNAATQQTCLGEALQFNNDSQQAGSYSWTFTNTSSGSSFTDENVNPSVSFPEIGSYTVTLSASGCGVNEITLEDYIQVDAQPISGIIADSTICLGSSVRLGDGGEATNFSWFPTAGLDDAASATPMFNASSVGEFTFDVTVRNDNDCFLTETVVITVSEDAIGCDVFIPDVITPNGDDINDVWNVSLLTRYADNEVRIYNRWGQLLFDAAPYQQNFDGTRNGKQLPNGTYYFVLNYSDGGQTITETGTLTILK